MGTLVILTLLSQDSDRTYKDLTLGMATVSCVQVYDIRMLYFSPPKGCGIELGVGRE
jgi:hypothetical protein